MDSGGLFAERCVILAVEPRVRYGCWSSRAHIVADWTSAFRPKNCFVKNFDFYDRWTRRWLPSPAADRHTLWHTSHANVTVTQLGSSWTPPPLQAVSSRSRTCDRTDRIRSLSRWLIAVSCDRKSSLWSICSVPFWSVIHCIRRVLIEIAVYIVNTILNININAYKNTGCSYFWRAHPNFNPAVQCINLNLFTVHIHNLKH